MRPVNLARFIVGWSIAGLLFAAVMPLPAMLLKGKTAGKCSGESCAKLVKIVRR